MKKLLPFLLIFSLSISFSGLHAQHSKKHKKKSAKKEIRAKKSNARFGMASFYAIKFSGRKTANREIHTNEKYSAACNVFPLNTWIRVTNLKNNKAVIVKINDRLHLKNKRLLDLSKSAAEELGYVTQGITRVKVEVLNNFQLQGYDVIKAFGSMPFLFLIEKIFQLIEPLIGQFVNPIN